MLNSKSEGFKLPEGIHRGQWVLNDLEFAFSFGELKPQNSQNRG